jgi:hypothetical protein
MTDSDKSTLKISALHAVGDSYMLLTRPSPQLPTVELRFQFRYAAAQPPRLLQLDPQTLWFSSAGQSSATPPAARRKVEKADVTQALTGIGEQVRYTQLRDQVMDLTECSKRTAQLAITEACRQGSIIQQVPAVVIGALHVFAVVGELRSLHRPIRQINAAPSL